MYKANSSSPKTEPCGTPVVNFRRVVPVVYGLDYYFAVELISMLILPVADFIESASRKSQM